MRLYEAERWLEGGAFARISNAEIVNLDRVRAFDLRLTGTIVVRFADGSVTYAARRYVTALKSGWHRRGEEMKKKVFLLCGAGALFWRGAEHDHHHSDLIDRGRRAFLRRRAGTDRRLRGRTQRRDAANGALHALRRGLGRGGAHLAARRLELTKQTALHLLVCSAATFPIAWACRWMRHDAAGAALYFGVFFAIYALIWLGQYLGIRRRLRKVNRALGAGKERA